MKTFFTWLTTSSTNPEAFSLTIKGVLTAIAPVVIMLTGLSSDDFGTLVNTIVSIALWGSSIVAGVMTVWGIARKITFGRWAAPSYSAN